MLQQLGELLMNCKLQLPSLSIHFTDLCNLRCPWCCAQSVMSRRPARLWSNATREHLFTHLRRTPYSHYIIHGGEPTLFPDEVVRVLTFIRTECPPDVPVSVFTNGTLLTPELIDCLNHFRARVLLSINLEGPKGLESFFEHVSDPDNCIRMIRKLHALCIRCVALRGQSFALEAVTMHNLFGGVRVETSPDVTTLNEWTEEDIRCVDKELTLLRRLDPHYRDWHSLLLTPSYRCDCSRKNINYTTSGQFELGPHKTSGRTYGCAFAVEQMGEGLYNQYIAVAQTAYDLLKGEDICPCSKSV